MRLGALIRMHRFSSKTDLIEAISLVFSVLGKIQKNRSEKIDFLKSTPKPSRLAAPRCVDSGAPILVENGGFSDDVIAIFRFFQKSKTLKIWKKTIFEIDLETITVGCASLRRFGCADSRRKLLPLRWFRGHFSILQKCC